LFFSAFQMCTRWRRLWVSPDVAGLAQPRLDPGPGHRSHHTSEEPAVGLRARALRKARNRGPFWMNAGRGRPCGRCRVDAPSCWFFVGCQAKRQSVNTVACILWPSAP